MSNRVLSEAEFRATLAAPMQEVTRTATDVLDIWPYVESIPPNDLEAHRVQDGIVEYVYRTPDDHFDHVLIPTNAANVYLVVVVDLVSDRVHGHRLLDLNREYGLS